MGQTRFLSLGHAIQVLSICLQRDFECTLTKKSAQWKSLLRYGFCTSKKSVFVVMHILLLNNIFTISKNDHAWIVLNYLNSS